MIIIIAAIIILAVIVSIISNDTDIDTSYKKEETEDKELEEYMVYKDFIDKDD